MFGGFLREVISEFYSSNVVTYVDIAVVTVVEVTSVWIRNLNVCYNCNIHHESWHFKKGGYLQRDEVE